MGDRDDARVERVAKRARLNPTLAQKVALNTVVQMAGRVAGIAVGLVTIRLTTTYLGIDGYGSLAIVVSVTGLAGIVADCGVVTTLAREVAKSPADAAHIGGNLLRFRIASSVAAAVIVAALLPFLPYTHTTKTGLAIGLVGMVFTILGAFPTAFFQTNLRLDYSAALDFATKVLGLGSILAVRGLDLGLYGLVALQSCGYAIVAVAAFALSRRFWRINLRFRWQAARPLIRDAVAIGVVTAIGLLHFRGDAMLLSILRPARDVGIYGIAYRFIDQAFMLPGLFIAAIFPVLTRALHRDRAEATTTINRSLQVLLLAAVSVAMGLFLLAGPLVRLVASAEFAGAVRPLRVLAFALVFVFVAPVFYNVLIVMNRQRQLIAIGLASLAFNVVLNLALIPHYGYMGAAATTVASEALSLAGTVWLARRHFPFEIRRSLVLGVAGASAVAVAVAAAVGTSSPWTAFFAAEAAFWLAAWALRAVTGADLRGLFNRAAVVGPGQPSSS